MNADGGAPTGGGAEARRDAHLAALADGQRRTLLRYLIAEYPQPVSRGAAVTHVASVRGEDHQRVAIRLVHSHLPRLEDAGLVSTDDENRLTYTGNEFVRDVLQLLAGHRAHGQ